MKADSLTIENLNLILESMKRIDKNDRTGNFLAFQNELLQQIKKRELFLKSSEFNFKVGDTVKLNKDYPYQSDSKYRGLFKLTKIRPHKNRKGGIGYKIKDQWGNSHYVSKYAILKVKSNNRKKLKTG